MSMTDSHGWEVLDMNKITVYLADLKSTIEDVGKDIGERLDALEERINDTDIIVNRIRDTIDSNYKHYERNKMLYMEILERLSVTNERVKPLLDKLNNNNVALQKGLCNPFIQSSRVYNRFWRSSLIPKRVLDKIPEETKEELDDTNNNTEIAENVDFKDLFVEIPEDKLQSKEEVFVKNI